MCAREYVVCGMCVWYVICVCGIWYVYVFVCVCDVHVCMWYICVYGTYGVCVVSVVGVYVVGVGEWPCVGCVCQEYMQVGLPVTILMEPESMSVSWAIALCFIP